ncbi:MAG TPA: RNB domain-containing ribonuclease [Casimicrobiaceae bacterium]|nr:RNB domain-containing ribonuclease [Casimicrobiaceae bacterium]
MNVLFEDDGQLKAGSVLADHDASLQVESASGKRLKIKASSVLLRFAAPGPAETLADAHRLAAELDATFLWEATGDHEFGFDELARDYYGAAPAPAQAAAVALLLAASPMHFHRKGKGRYRKAPAEALKAALASVERKRREAAQADAWTAELAANRLPEAFRPKLSMLLYKPDKNALEWKALTRACETLKTNPVDLLARCGAIPSTHEFHYNRFLAEAFPGGVAHPPRTSPLDVPPLPPAPVRAFSIDDASTTEIDDAFSVTALPNGHCRIGIHIACPALAMPRGSADDALARARLSTVYMPGRKLTMLPDDLVAAFTLASGTTPPALSLYIDTDHAGRPLAHRTAVERLPVVANLRLPEITDAFANELPSPGDPPWTEELRALWKLATRLGEARGKPDIERIDYNFYVDWDAAGVDGEPGRVDIVPRPRGSPLDKLVAELMIHVNATWGKLLADAGVPGLYRVQSNGKVKMSTRPGEHQGLGLSHYLWASSPLRRYCDLVNQRQILAVTAGERAPYGDNDAELYAALVDFEATYAQYAEFQDRMEHYWCMRWLRQENVVETTATVIRDNLVRFTRLPVVQRLPDLPALPQNSPVRVAIVDVDLRAASFSCRYAGPVAQ